MSGCHHGRGKQLRLADVLGLVIKFVIVNELVENYCDISRDMVVVEVRMPLQTGRVGCP